MHDIENPSGKELSPEWQEVIRESIDEQLESFEVLFGATDENPESALNFSPLSFSSGYDEREYDELSPEEKDFIKQAMFSGIGFNPEDAQIVSTYKYDGPEGSKGYGAAEVTVYETIRSDEGMFLHMATYPDGREELFVASKDYRL